MRSKLIAIGLALTTFALAVPAFADQSKTPPSFPMPAAEFSAKITNHEAKAREHMEARAQTLPADQATALRARFDQKIANENAELAKAVADGTVTKDEAKAVWKAGPHRHHKKDAGTSS